MDRDRRNCRWVTLSALALAGVGCSAYRPSVSQGPVERPETSAAARTAAAQDPELRMFGRMESAGGDGDVVFEGQAVGEREQHTSVTDGADFDPAINAAGTQLVFASTRHSPRSALYLKSVLGATVTQLTDAGANDAEPAFSPDGRRIAFVSDRTGNWDIWVIDLDGRHPMQITNSPMPDLHPSWSPDGEQLVYSRVNPKENRGELWVSNLKTPGVHKLIGEGLFPEWSPTGERIVYQRARERGSRWFSIWTLDYDISTGEARYPTEIASSPAAALISPHWSPDGTQVAFAVVTPGAPEAGPAGAPQPVRAEIAIVDADGRGRQVVTDGRGACYAPAWSGDGRIYYSMKDGDSETIWSVRPMRSPIPGAPPAARQAAAPESSKTQAMNAGIVEP